MIGWIVLTVVILFFTWLLLAPVRLQINTLHGFFRLRILGIASAEYRMENDPFGIKLRVLFFRKRIGLEDMIARKAKSQKEDPEKAEKPTSKWKNKRKRKGGMKFRTLVRLVRNLLKSFRIREFRIWVDTGDFVRNSQLYPLTVASWGRKPEVLINYQGKNALLLDMENRLGSVAWAFLRTYIVH